MDIYLDFMTIHGFRHPALATGTGVRMSAGCRRACGAATAYLRTCQVEMGGAGDQPQIMVRKVGKPWRHYGRHHETKILDVLFSIFLPAVLT